MRSIRSHLDGALEGPLPLGLGANVPEFVNSSPVCPPICRTMNPAKCGFFCGRSRPSAIASTGCLVEEEAISLQTFPDVLRCSVAATFFLIFSADYNGSARL